MKTILLHSIFLISITFLAGCKTFIQVFETKTINTIKEDEFYVYETDTLKITYAFWTKKGILAFSVFNKLNVPIYIDWKKSSFIYNSKKLNYWIDEEISKYISYFGSYYYNGPIFKPVKYTVNEGVSTGTSSKIKVERITFIPPNSNFYRSQFYLLPIEYYNLDVNSSFIEDNLKNNSNKKTKIYFKEFTRENSPLVFRNFIAFSLTEDFKNEFYIDNEFYISKINEMNYKYYVFKNTLENNTSIKSNPFKEKTSFYLIVPTDKNIDKRKKFEKLIR